MARYLRQIGLSLDGEEGGKRTSHNSLEFCGNMVLPKTVRYILFSA